MATSTSDGGDDGNSKNPDNLNAVCGYKDITQFSQVAYLRHHLIATLVMDQMLISE